MTSRAAASPDEDLEALYAAKAAAEVAEAAAGLASGAFAPSGSPAAAVLLLKGEPGPGDRAAGRALAGPDGEAAARSLEALGLPGETLAVVTRGPGEDAPGARAVRRVVDACDPAWVIALDASAAEDAAAALGVRRLAFGEPRTVRGRVWLAVDGLEASLTDPARKRRVWAQLKTIAADAAAADRG